jgi:ubiquinone/menaquinone biosynthesis C-methylase UbiE
MNEKFLINHKRFKNKKSVIHAKKYFEFFNNYAKKNYTLVDNNCLCGVKDDELISMVDRCSVEFKTVICKNCGLVRAPKYFRKDDVDDFYKNFYRTIMNNSEDYNEPEKFFERQTINSLEKYKLIKENSNNDLKGLKVLDLGGGAGGALEHFKNDNDLYLADFFDPYLEYAKKKGVNVIKSGLKDINFKPDIIILSHVIEHWNDFEIEIQNLINIQKKNKTINYIELPGIDSLKNGRRGGDFLQDIHIPHVYYFSSYVLENLMNKYGFEKLYIDSEIKSLFIYTGEKKETKKYYKKVKEDLIKAEFRRKIQIFKNIIKIFIPRVVLNIIKRN